MHTFILLLSLVTLSYQHEVILIEGIRGCPPTRICEINGLDDVVASGSNVSFLMTMLCNLGIESAAVGGWNDHISYDSVLRVNGALAPYNPKTNNANYAFCITRGKGCNRQRHCATPCPLTITYPVSIYDHCAQEPVVQQPTCYPPVVVPCVPEPTPCVPVRNPCSSDSSETACDPCPKYVKQTGKYTRIKIRKPNAMIESAVHLKI